MEAGEDLGRSYRAGLIDVTDRYPKQTANRILGYSYQTRNQC